VTVVHVPSPLFSYTGGRAKVAATGATLADILSDLDRQFPGFRFRVVDEQDRIRSTILFYAGGTVTRSLLTLIGAADEVHIIAALSGG
jgi:molybdopterin synthase sulfur carrier subunit